MLNFLTDSLIRARLISGEVKSLSLPALYACLLLDEIEAFPALRPHQRHVWHAFLVQIGALALFGAGQTTPGADEAHWRELLRGLTAKWPDDSPWCLVAPLNRPALLQPPVPEGSLTGFNTIATPDELDMLITSKNHDLKSSVASRGQPEDWFFALLSLQTQEGYSGSTLNGISRMNGGSSSRLGIGLEPGGGPGRRVARDISRLLNIRDSISRDTGIPFLEHSGSGLLWLEPWDGTTSISFSKLDPFYVEVCRRVRLERQHSEIIGWSRGSGAVRRITEAETQHGFTGDPWAPLKEKGNAISSETIQGNGLGYKQVVQLIFPSSNSKENRRVAPLQVPAGNDRDSRNSILLRVVARGNSKTFGYLERRVPISIWINHGFTGRESDPIAKIANARVKNAGEVSSCLRFGLGLLVEPDRQPRERVKPQTEKAVRPWLDRFDLGIDRAFFSEMEREVLVLGNEVAEQVERNTWLRALHAQGRDLIEDAAASLARGGMRRLRAIVRAKGAFSGLFYKGFPHLRPARADESAEPEEISV